MTAILRWALVLIAVVGLGIDAFTHLDLASSYSHNTTGTVNQGVLFQIEASLAIAAAVLLVVRQNLITTAFAVLVAGGGAFVLLLYRYVDVGKIGPIPNMNEPVWYPEKEQSLTGELIALGASLILLGLAAYARFGARRANARRSTHPLAA
jgi:hypothetical protein